MATINVYNIDCMEGERFLPFAEAEYFLVSSLGRVYSTLSKKILSPVLMTNGYVFVSGRERSFTVHRMVAKCFIPNPENLPCINHKDYNKLNNCIENLEWCNYSYNTKHSYESGNHNRIRPIVATCIKTGEEFKYPSAREAEKDGFANQLISKCCKGKRRSHKGFTFHYANN